MAYASGFSSKNQFINQLNHEAAQLVKSANDNYHRIQRMNETKTKIQTR